MLFCDKVPPQYLMGYRMCYKHQALLQHYTQFKTEQTPSRRHSILIEGGLCPLALRAPLISYSCIQGERREEQLQVRAEWVTEQRWRGGRKLWLKDGRGEKKKRDGRGKAPTSLSSLHEPISGSCGGEERLWSWSSTQTRIKGNPHLIQMSFECFMVAKTLRWGADKMWLKRALIRGGLSFSDENVTLRSFVLFFLSAWIVYIYNSKYWANTYLSVERLDFQSPFPFTLCLDIVSEFISSWWGCSSSTHLHSKDSSKYKTVE